VLVLTTSIVFLLLLIYFTAPKIESLRNIRWVSYSEFIKNVDNGDLVLFSGDSRGERTCRWFSGSPFSHIGLILREPASLSREDIQESIVYIWEVDIGQGSRRGPRIMKLEDKIREYKGFKVLGWTSLQEGPRPSREAILKLIPKYIDHELDNLMWMWVIARLGVAIEKRDKVFCSELVALSLQDLGILKKSTVATRFSPGDFYLSGKSPPGVLPPYVYSKTVLVKFPQ